MGQVQERQSSSGLIVSTGTGATGWASSIQRERGGGPPLAGPTASELCWFVREAWPSISTGTGLIGGRLAPTEEFTLISEMEAGVVFGDGIEAERLSLGWGQPVTLQLAPERLRLVR